MTSHKVITIAQQKGGAGKTTIAAHLAIALSQRGLKVAAIDIDPQGSLTTWHKLREQRFGEEFTGLHFSSLSGWRVGSEVNRLKNDFDAIIIDSPPHTQTEAKTAIREADLVIIPVQPSPTDIWATEGTIELTAKERIPFMMLLNRVNPSSKLASKIIKKLVNPMKTQIGNRVAFAQSLMEGRCVTETAPKSPASEEVKALSKEVWNFFAPAKPKKAQKSKPAKTAARESVRASALETV